MEVDVTRCTTVIYEHGVLVLGVHLGLECLDVVWAGERCLLEACNMVVFDEVLRAEITVGFIGVALHASTVQACINVPAIVDWVTTLVLSEVAGDVRCKAARIYSCNGVLHDGCKTV